MSAEFKLDGEQDLPRFSPICSHCIHVSLEKRKVCAAFPAGIPDEIWKGENPHVLPVDGDHGIRFQKRPGP